MNSKDYSGIAAAYSSIYADPYLEAKNDVKSILESLYVFETSEETEYFVEDLFTEDAEAIEFVLELYTITEESGFLLTEDVYNLQEDVENLHEILGALRKVGAKVASKAGPALSGLKSKAGAALGGLKSKAGAALSKVTGAVKKGVGAVKSAAGGVVQKGKDLVNRAAVAYGNKAGLKVVNPNTGKTLSAKGNNLGLTQGSATARKAMRDAVVKDVKGKVSGAVDKVKSAVGGALKNPVVRNVAKAALPIGAAVAGIAALNKSGGKLTSSSRGEGRAVDRPEKPKVSNIPPTDGLINNPNYGRPADKSTWKNKPGSPSRGGTGYADASGPGKASTPKKRDEPLWGPGSKTPDGKPSPTAPKPKTPPASTGSSGSSGSSETVRTNNINLPKRESWRRPKAELEQIRGNAALQSISQSRNAERILKGKKGREALERSSAMLNGDKDSRKASKKAFDALGIAEAYASIYEKKDCVDKKDKGAHNCAKKVCHEEYGEGETIFGQHAVPDENGFVSHYDVEFEHVIVENVPVEELEIITESSHPTAEGHRYEGEMIDEADNEVFRNRRPFSDAGEYPMRDAMRDAGMNRAPNAAPIKKASAKKSTPQKKMAAESVDVFDVIKGYLIDEGYADSEESALAIMANMSEEWRTEIIEGCK